MSVAEWSGSLVEWERELCSWKARLGPVTTKTPGSQPSAGA